MAIPPTKDGVVVPLVERLPGEITFQRVRRSNRHQQADGIAALPAESGSIWPGATLDHGSCAVLVIRSMSLVLLLATLARSVGLGGKSGEESTSRWQFFDCMVRKEQPSLAAV